LYNRSAAEDSPVNLLGFNNSVNLIHQRQQRALIVIAQNNYLRINDAPFLNTGFAHIRGHFRRGRRTSVEVYSQYSYDNFRRLNPRLLLGSNLRARLFSSEAALLTVGIGPMLEYEAWQHPFTEEMVRLTLLKANAFIALRAQITDVLDYNGVVYFQSGYDPDIGRFRNRVSHSSNILARVSKRISLTVAFEFNYEDRPVVPITPFIFSLRNGLAYRFK
jgi:hypothetical protein